jgi:uncharacterized protein with FMN-binding domain
MRNAHRETAHRGLAIGCVLGLVCLAGAARADEVELLNGARLQGRIAEQTEEFLILRVASADGDVETKVPLKNVHAVSIGGKRHVVNERTSGKQEGPSAAPAATPPPKEGAGPRGRTERSRAEVDAAIQKAGTTQPDWWGSVPLDYPRTLDLSWPDKPPGPWDASKNVGQYIWSSINENPSRWRSGVRFLHYLLTVHKDNPAKLAKVMEALGMAYCNLLRDWARAAFWWRKAEEREPLGLHAVVLLAECYWKLGSKTLATEQLDKTRGYLLPEAVKLWADMGELDRALGLADKLAEAEPGWQAEAYVAAAEACRFHGRYGQAKDYLEKALREPAEGQRKGRIERAHTRARASLEAILLHDTLELSRVPDGTYTGTGMAYAAPLTVAVAVRDGHIESVRVTQHQDKQFYGALADTPRRIVERQGVKGVDAVTGATITSEAILNATAKALAGAMK